MAKRIVIEIKPDGNVVLEAQGHKGPVCLKSTKWLEDALGGKVKSRVFKKDYHETEMIVRKS